jgi:Tfp pilus assembly protein PilN
MKLGRKTAESSTTESASIASSLATNAAAFPRVNLIPSAVTQEGKLRKAKLSVLAAVAFSLLAIAGLYVMAQGQVGAAQEQLDAATGRTAALTTQLQGFQDFQNARGDLTDAQKQLDLAMGGEVRWSSLINDISLTLPSGTSLTEFKGAVDGVTPTIRSSVKDLIAEAEQYAKEQYDGQKQAGNNAAVQAVVPASPILSTTSVLGNDGIGIITYTGEANSYADVAQFLDVVSKQHTMLDPYPNNVQISNAGSGGQGLSFSAEVTVTDQALSRRFSAKAGS